jgi:hypothetical protein
MPNPITASSGSAIPIMGDLPSSISAQICPLMNRLKLRCLNARSVIFKTAVRRRLGKRDCM